MYSASKDASIVQWHLTTRRKTHRMPGVYKKKDAQLSKGHTDHILTLAISSDGQVLASGGRDKAIHIWKTEHCNLFHTFKKHKDAVSALAFQKNSRVLYSASHDLNLHLWNCDEAAGV